MSIITKTGDKGTTGLMYGQRVLKCHPRVEACGAVDELNAALGLARALAQPDSAREQLLFIQEELIVLMGELAVPAEQLERYARDGHALVTSEMTVRLERKVYELEAGSEVVQGWATPGASVPAAALDVARTVCRRAERCVCALLSEGQLRNHEVLIYLNRLSDLLWLFARRAEAKP